MGVSYDHHHPVLNSLETLRGLGLQVSLKMKEKNSLNSPQQKFAEGLRGIKIPDYLKFCFSPESSKPCVFPFQFGDKKYFGCLTEYENVYIIITSST